MEATSIPIRTLSVPSPKLKMVVEGKSTLCYLIQYGDTHTDFVRNYPHQYHDREVGHGLNAYGV